MGLKLKPSEKIFLDTAPFIYYFEEHPSYISKLKKLFDNVYEMKTPVITSMITYIELLTYPERTNMRKLAAKYRDSLTASELISIYPLDFHIADISVKLRAKHNLKTPDAIQVATAMASGSDYLITNDAKLKKIKAAVQVLLVSEI